MSGGSPARRVCFLGHCAEMSGAEIALRRLLRALPVDSVVILADDGPFVDALHSDGVDVRVVRMPASMRGFRRSGRPWEVATALWSLLRFLVATRRAVASTGATLVHTNSMKAHLYGGLVGRSLGLPVLWHVRDRLTPDYLGVWLSRLVRGAARVVPHVVAATSRSTADTVGRRDVIVVPDCQDFLTGAGSAAAPPVREEVRCVGMVGRIAQWKGQHVLLGALHRLRSAPRCRIVGRAMFGDDAYEADLQRLAAGLDDRVEFRGFRSDVHAELAELDVVVHASTIPEPFGQVVIEAMAAGVPVVASAAGGPAEVVSHGVDGLLVAPGDARALADALEELRDADRRRELRDAALVTASRYSPKRTAAAVLDAYGRLPSSGFSGRSLRHEGDR